jgi:hypothetical protein
MDKMAIAGRDVLKWLALPYVQLQDRLPFENALSLIAEPAEEWLSSQEGMQMSRPTPPARNVYLPGPPPAAPGRRVRPAVPSRRRGRPVPSRV